MVGANGSGIAQAVALFPKSRWWWILKQTNTPVRRRSLWLDSMLSRFMMLEHGPEPRNGQIVAALVDRESTLKTFIVKSGKPYLRAENPKYPKLIPAEELMIQGVLKALIWKAKE